jgi:hypothetical protein
LQVQRRLTQCLVFRQDDLHGLVLVGGCETGAFSRGGINSLELQAALAAADQTVSLFHTLCAITAQSTVIPAPLRAVGEQALVMPEHSPSSDFGVRFGVRLVPPASLS